MSVLHASRRTPLGVVALSVAAAVVVVASAATLFAAGRDDAIEDNQAGALLVPASLFLDVVPK